MQMHPCTKACYKGSIDAPSDAFINIIVNYAPLMLFISVLNWQDKKPISWSACFMFQFVHQFSVGYIWEAFKPPTTQPKLLPCQSG